MVSLLAFDTVLLLVVTLLHVYRVTIISVPLLFAGNFVVLWLARHHFASGESSVAFKIHWLPTVVFTLAAIVAITAFAVKPSTYSASQAGIGIVLAGYCWYINYRTLRFQQKQPDEPPRKA